MMKTDNFIEQCVQGSKQPSEIDDAVDAWHNGRDTRPLHEFLGMTMVEYALWVAEPDKLQRIISNRKKKLQ